MDIPPSDPIDPAAPQAPAKATRAGGGRGAGRRRGRRPPRHVRRRRLIALAVVLVVVLALAAGVGYSLVRDFFGVGPEGARVTVTIPPGSSLRQIGVILERARVVPHAAAFEYRAKRDGYSTTFKSGTYQLHVNEPYNRLVAALAQGPALVTIKVTIPEGYTARQTATLLARTIPGFSAERYLDLTLYHPLPFSLPGFQSGGPLEGLLFPATYDVQPGVPERQFVELQLQAFRENFASVDMREARRHNLTAYDVVILGSMIEREIAVPDERALAAAVMWRRLHLGMPLQIDATIEYVLPEQKAQLSYQDLKIQSPYNTYLHTGLPPTPISNPGAAALRAAAHPAAVDYLYYVARGDGSGRHYFSSSYAQFLKDKARAEAP